jgi:hypothetical protein
VPFYRINVFVHLGLEISSLQRQPMGAVLSIVTVRVRPYFNLRLASWPSPVSSMSEFFEVLNHQGIPTGSRKERKLVHSDGMFRNLLSDIDFMSALTSDDILLNDAS